ncbi:hypothetical protein TeGR_g13028 [Tetraparma gracilis]|uniref:Dephospho-CoA kinase n=1 Tax=Tetraparma gracilis TaxID=2962635 RepID=A0ABQ6MZ24_9STRA|nr:hypothetical protein TeGR_g13028 [Tetraparma gracilis]
MFSFAASWLLGTLTGRNASLQMRDQLIALALAPAIGLLAGALLMRAQAKKFRSVRHVQEDWRSALSSLANLPVLAGMFFGVATTSPESLFYACTRRSLEIARAEGDRYTIAECKEYAFMHSFLTFWICCSFLWWLAVANTLQPIGITGGIACGKSTICKILKKQDNVAIVDLDEIAHDVQRPPKKGEAVMNNCYQTILETFPGKKITKRDGSIDRKKLGDIVFADPAKRRLLEAIMRPKIMQAMVWRMVTGKMFRTNTKLMIEAPLLFEAPILRYIFGIIIVVSIPPDEQLKRLKKRNPELTTAQCEQRLEAQMPLEEKKKMATIVIENDKSEAEMEEVCKQVLKDIEHNGMLSMEGVFFIFMFGRFVLGIW